MERALDTLYDRNEFEIEGELEIASINGYAVFRIDDCSLAEFVAFHFGARWEDGRRQIGRCKVVIIPIEE